MDGKAQPLTPVRAEQERVAVELRRAGVDYPTIARKMQLSGPGQAYKIVQRALKRSIQEPAEDVRVLELARLDDLHAGLWDQAKRGDTYSVDRVLKIQERRAKYLGLDAPTKIAPTTPDGKESIPLGIAAILAELPAGIRAAVIELAAQPDDAGATGETPGGLPEAD